MILGLKTSRNNSHCKLNLRMDGTDNGTTFTDSSPSNKIITRNGTVTKTAIKKFGTASAYFDGISYYLQSTDDDDWSFGNSDFAVEAWVYQSNLPSASERFIVGQYGTNVADRSWAMVCYYLSGAVYPPAQFYYDISQNLLYSLGISTVTSTTWHHVSINRTNGQIKIFLDGILQGSILTTESLQSVTKALRIGSQSDGFVDKFFNGYIDSVSIYKGKSLHKTNFIIPNMMA